MHGVLAQSTEMRSVFGWGIALIVFLLGGFILVTMVRKRLRDADSTLGTGGGGFTLTELRELHSQGKLSDVEFEKAKYAIVENIKAQSARAAAAKAEAANPQKRR